MAYIPGMGSGRCWRSCWMGCTKISTESSRSPRSRQSRALTDRTPRSLTRPGRTIALGTIRRWSIRSRANSSRPCAATTLRAATCPSLSTRSCQCPLHFRVWRLGVFRHFRRGWCWFCLRSYAARTHYLPTYCWARPHTTVDRCLPCRYLSLPIGSGDKTRTLSVDVCRMSGFGATNHAVKVLKFGETRPRAAADVERSSPSCNACD
jgi:hypothetical protein